MTAVAADGVRFFAGLETVIEPGAVVGQLYDGWSEPARLGERCRIRTGTLIYADVAVGDRLVTGIGALLRPGTVMGSGCLVGTGTVIEGHARFGDGVVIQSSVFVPTHTAIGDRVFLGPCAVLTNDRYPLRCRDTYVPEGPTIESDASVGANATILPGVTIGQGAMVAAGAVVTADVPAWTLAVGVPARIVDLPDHLREANQVRAR